MQAMSLGEFDLIERFFKRAPTAGPRYAVVGNGDDCAVIAPTPGMQMAISTDTLVEGRHFLSTVPPERLGHKALAVNLSDLAACGARPRAFTLALTLPRVDEAWLAAFSGGLLALADQHGCELIGGDTTSGPLSITITVLGEVPAGQALLRSGAQVGDDCWVSGQPGEARLALEAFRGQWQPPLGGEAFEAARARMECPTPRVELGLALRGLATSAIDLSDGLLGDLAHVLKGSGVGALISLDLVPHSPLLLARPLDQQLQAILAGGDDYELLFTAPAEQRHQIQTLSTALSLPLTCIGVIEAAAGLRLCQGSLDAQPPALIPNCWSSFDHFKA
jgi:thiamine-monophosphate kinase